MAWAPLEPDYNNINYNMWTESSKHVETFPHSHHLLEAQGFYLCRCEKTGRQIYVREMDGVMRGTSYGVSGFSGIGVSGSSGYSGGSCTGLSGYSGASWEEMEERLDSVEEQIRRARREGR